MLKDGAGELTQHGDGLYPVSGKGAGKGSRPRTWNTNPFRENFEAIDWSKKPKPDSSETKNPN